MDRLERDGFVRRGREGADGPSGQNVYVITDAGRAQLEAWFSASTMSGTPARDELVLKLVMAARHAGSTAPR